MRNPLAGAALLLALLACAPAGQAAINKPLPFHADFPFSDGIDAGALRIVSGRLDAELASASGTWGFFATEGAVLTGLRQACWSTTQCTQSQQDDVAIVVVDGGSFGLSLPDTADATLGAPHALGLFVDFGGEDDLNSLTLGRSLVAPLVDGKMAFTRIPPIPAFNMLRQDQGGGIAALDESTTLNVYRGDTLVASRSGKVDPIAFSGNPRMEPFAVGSAVLPFGGSSVAYFAPSPASAAKEGLDLARVQALSQELQQAQEGGQGGGGQPEVKLGGFDRLLAEVMNGAVLGLPNDASGASGNASFAESFVFVRFSRLAVAVDGASLSWDGRAPLQVRDGEVKGAEPLVGFAYVALPWWSYVLWGLAIAVLIVRIVRQPPKKNERWDRLRWIGWVAGIVAFVAVFLLWDHETKAVWGTSLLTTDAGGKALGITALIELVPLSLVMFAAAAPLRMLLRNGLLLAKQGTFMGLSGAIATLAGYLIGAHLMLSYLELILVQVIEKLG